MTSPSSWRAAAEQLVAEIHATLPADADFKTRRRALRGAGWPAHVGTASGRKMWGRVVREYLARYDTSLPPGGLFQPTRLDIVNAQLRADRGEPR